MAAEEKRKIRDQHEHRLRWQVENLRCILQGNLDQAQKIKVEDLLEKAEKKELASLSCASLEPFYDESAGNKSGPSKGFVTS